MTLHAWLLFCVTETALCLSPGPSTLAVLSLALTRGRAASALAALGVLAANAVYFTLSASGLVAAHAVSAEMFLAIKWAGALYLIALGARRILHTFRARGEPPPDAPPPSPRRSFWHGFVTEGANPNLLVYFTAILPQLVDA